jgi:hypothetical protein
VQLFVWRTGATSGYFDGSIAVCARTVDLARLKIAADINRWLKFGQDESSPVAHDFDPKTGVAYDGACFEETEKAMEKARAEVMYDISQEPMTPDVYWRGGRG